MRLASWEDIEVRARTCPVLHRVVIAVNEGVDREVAMCEALMFLSKEREASIEREIDRLKFEPFPIFIVPKE